jgi:hypothetical protein
LADLAVGASYAPVGAAPASPASFSAIVLTWLEYLEAEPDDSAGNFRPHRRRQGPARC